MELSRTSLLWSKYGVGLGMIVKFFSVTVFLVLFFTEKEGISLFKVFLLCSMCYIVLSILYNNDAVTTYFASEEYSKET